MTHYKIKWSLIFYNCNELSVLKRLNRCCNRLVVGLIGERDTEILIVCKSYDVTREKERNNSLNVVSFTVVCVCMQVKSVSFILTVEANSRTALRSEGKRTQTGEYGEEIATCSSPSHTSTRGATNMSF